MQTVPQIELINQWIAQLFSRQEVSDSGTLFIIGEQISSGQSTLVLVDRLLALK